MRSSIFTLFFMVFGSYAKADSNRQADLVFDYVELSDTYLKFHEFLNTNSDLRYKQDKDSHNKFEIFTPVMQNLVNVKFSINSHSSQIGISIDEKKHTKGKLKNRIITAMNSWENKAYIICKTQQCS